MIVTTLLLTRDVLACEEADVRNALSAVEGAFRTLQSVRAKEPRGRQLAIPAELALTDVHRAVDCLESPMSAQLAGRVHAAEALTSWLADDRPRGVLALRSMLSANPWGALPMDLIPPEHGLRVWIAEAGEVETVWDPSLSKWALVDGIPTRAIPTGQPYVLQHRRNSGAMRSEFVDATGKSSGGNRTPFIVTGLALGAAGLGAYGGAWATHVAYQDATDLPSATSLHTTTNLLSIGSVVVGGIGATVLTVGLVK
ncbi:MAG: hypothetical protein KC621_33205 [Myxococcales bacterium]|nr:hypothetical protein [Myxococcales bacterium]